MTCVAAVADEIAFWQAEDGSANPDTEILRAIRPSLLTTRGPLIAISSPYARSSSVKPSPMAAMRKMRQGSQLSPPNAAPKRFVSLRARRMVTKGVMSAYRRLRPLAAVLAHRGGESRQGRPGAALWP